MQTKKTSLVGCLLAGALLGGCGSNDTDGVLGGGGGSLNNGPGLVSGRTLTITEPNFPSRGADRVDTVEVEGFNAAGQRVFGPVRLPVAPSLTVAGVPDSVVSLELDYLRNGGFMLFRANVPVVNGQVLVKDPAEVATELHDTHFDVVPDGSGGFNVIRDVRGAPLTTASAGVAAKVDAEPFRVKGVCYSPAPINSTNQKGGALGDLFWDTLEIAYPGGTDYIYNWAALWASFSDPNIGVNGKSRGDLAKIREMGCNTVRVYSLLAYQLTESGGYPDLNDPKTTRFSHKAFLDTCWNNGDHPLHVIIDIPMPDSAYQFAVRTGLFTREANAGNPNVEQLVAEEVAKWNKEVDFWERNMRAIVEDTHDHPAVLGYNIMNEKGGDRSSSPNGGHGPDGEEPAYFYAQSAKYADLIKSIDSTKLVGWAYHDSPAMVNFASKFPASGPKYLEKLGSFDYYGINSYQSKSLDSIVGPGFFGNYSDLPDSMKKPVLLTEMGWPATTHEGGVESGKLTESEASHNAVKEVINLLFPQVFQNKLFMGVCYFEFTDEWWKQGPDLGPVSDATWDGGKTNTDRPNKFNDEEGFGLYSIARQGGRPNTDQNYITFGPDPNASFGSKGPKQPYDKITPRQPLIDALTAIYNRF